ncbi:MAG TPA: MFS transporter [Ktedonobacteraceae bacterium]|nr:MFS transporter [Ktedonobacteraceae bacterium]
MPENVHSFARCPSGPWSVLRNRDYALFFWGQLISSAGTEMQVVAVAWQVYIVTHSAVALGVIGLMRAIPRLLFSLVGGVLADVLDRRKMLMAINLTMMGFSAVLAFCTNLHVINVVIIYSVILLSATVSAFDFPTRQAIIPSLVTRDQMASALSLSATITQLAFIAGPTLGGFAIGWLGLAATYWFDVISYLAVIGSLCLMVVPRVPVEKRARPGFGALFDGMRFLRTSQIILSVLILDFCANFFGEASAMLPVYAQNIMHIGPQGLGLLLAAPALGAVALAPFTGVFARIKRRGVGVMLAPVVWGLCIAAFGFLPNPPWLGVLFLAGSGAADMASIVLRGLIIQAATPDAYRGRVGAVSAIFVLGGPMLGQFESGLIGGLFSPTISVVGGGLACVLVSLLIAAVVPDLIRVSAP